MRAKLGRKEFIESIEALVKQVYSGCEEFKVIPSIDENGNDVLTFTWKDLKSEYYGYYPFFQPKIVLMENNIKADKLNKKGKEYWEDYDIVFRGVKLCLMGQKTAEPNIQLTRKISFDDKKNSAVIEQSYVHIRACNGTFFGCGTLGVRDFKASLFARINNSLAETWENICKTGSLLLNRLVSVCSFSGKSGKPVEPISLQDISLELKEKAGEWVKTSGLPLDQNSPSTHIGAASGPGAASSAPSSGAGPRNQGRQGWAARQAELKNQPGTTVHQK